MVTSASKSPAYLASIACCSPGVPLLAISAIIACMSIAGCAAAMDGRELKAYERFKEQAEFFRDRAYHLEGELRVLRPELHRAYQRIDRLEQRVEKLDAENALLKQRLKEVVAAREQAHEQAE